MSGVKRNVLNVKQKLEILQKLDNEESASTDAEDVLNEGNTISHYAALQSVETLLDYMRQRGFEYDDITALYLCPVSKQHDSYIGTDLINLTRDLMTRTTPELAPPSVGASEEIGDPVACRRLEFATVHWDGKLLPAITRNKKVDRLPLFISTNGQEHLLRVSQLASCSGDDMAASIYNLLAENKLLETVQALCCDTTASNTGRIKCACVLLERKLGKDLLYLPCRHHIYELALKSAFEACITTSS
ncbi:hypothetical protein AVEN_234317-1 [Araneus ventricosus]|uniref:Uncharacterized protein n=1 Tax=Araneus ventricosus TaxID=182803 RepID=A0A4Y2A822_ARAVE|nr:hypothetical protein AVEN_234317-1 [Araneus ventricosus]